MIRVKKYCIDEPQELEAYEDLINIEGIKILEEKFVHSTSKFVRTWVIVKFDDDEAIE